MKIFLLIGIFLTGFLEPVSKEVAPAAMAMKVSGKVTDGKHALPGVRVVLKGNNSRAVVTNKEGKYSIKVPGEQAVLVFSFLGFETKEVPVKGRKVLDVVLIPSPAQPKVVRPPLETEEALVEIVPQQDQVVVGYGRQAKSRVTGGIRPPVYYPRPRVPYTTEDYSPINENRFLEVINNPLSTFSIDVDAASYSNVRRFLDNGSLPPKDAVRIEELINYFDYDYEQPRGQHPVNIVTEMTEAPWNKEHRLVRIGLQGKEIPVDDLPASNLVFLIDVSGSMQPPNKLPLLKKGFRLLIEQLREKDRVAIVTYASQSGVALESTSGNEKRRIRGAIEGLHAGGSTAGGAGIREAYRIARNHFIEGGNNRVILATDGDFNVGVSSDGELQRLIERERESGVFLSVLGFGMGNYKDNKLELLADKGNGNYAYIDTFNEARKVMVSEFGGTLFTIAKDVKLQIEFNPHYVKSYRLVGYENRLLNAEDFEDDHKDAGEMGSGHTVTASYEIVPADKAARKDQLKYQDIWPSQASEGDEVLTVKLRYKDPDGESSKEISQVLRNHSLLLAKASDNHRFAAAVAGFGLLLRDSEFKGTATYEQMIGLAQGARGTDREGYRAGLISLLKTAQLLDDGRENEEEAPQPQPKRRRYLYPAY